MNENEQNPALQDYGPQASPPPDPYNAPASPPPDPYNAPGLEDFPDELMNQVVPVGNMPDGVRFDYDPSDGEFKYLDTQHPDLSFWDRFKLKNFSANPNAMRGWLGKLGYDTKDIPGREGEFNFAIRKGLDSTWYVVDPEGVDAQDFSDLVADGTIALGSTAAGITTILGGGAVAAGGETLRQGAGALMGAPDNMDLASIGLQGVGGALFPAVGRGAIKVGESLGSNILMRAGAKISGMRGSAGLPGNEVLAGRAAIKSRTLRNPVDAAQELLSAVRSTGRSRLPAWTRANAIEKSVDEAGGFVNARATRDMLQEYGTTGQAILNGPDMAQVDGIRKQLRGLLTEAIGGATSAETQEEAVQVAIRDAARLVATAPNSASAFSLLGEVMDNYLELAHGTTDWGKLPVTVASELKTVIDHYARSGNAYSGQGEAVATSVGLLAKRLKGTLGASIKDTMKGSPLYEQWAAERAGVAKGMRVLTGFRKRLFQKGNEDEFTSVSRAAGVISELYGNKPWQIRNMLAQWKEVFGVDLETGLMREAGINSAMTGSETATGQLLPRVRFTALGTPFGMAAMGTGGYIASGGDPWIAGASALAAPFIFSPAGVVAGTRLAQKTFRPAMLAGQAASQATYHGAVANRTRAVMAPEPPRRSIMNR